MSKMGYWRYKKLQSVLDQVLHRNRSSSVWQRKSPETAIGRFGYSLRYQGLHLFSTSSRETWTTFGTTKVNGGKEKVQPPSPASPRRYFPYWARWFWGSILIVLPFSKDTWAKVQAIEGEAEMVAEEVENVAEVVEKVATVAEKVSSDLADKLPDNGKLKESALFVEHVSKIVAQDAQKTQDFFHKVDELKDDLENLETVIKPPLIVKAKHGSEEK